MKQLRSIVTLVFAFLSQTMANETGQAKGQYDFGVKVALTEDRQLELLVRSRCQEPVLLESHRIGGAECRLSLWDNDEVVVGRGRIGAPSYTLLSPQLEKGEERTVASVTRIVVPLPDDVEFDKVKSIVVVLNFIPLSSLDQIKVGGLDDFLTVRQRWTGPPLQITDER